MLTIIEKVLLLQEIDIFKNTTTEDLAHIAAIAEEVHFAAGKIIYREGEISDAMFVMVEGKVSLQLNEKELMTAKKPDVFGSWALFDEEPRVVTATTLEESVLLRVDREEFLDLLADHSRITRSVLKTLASRVRSLIGRVQVKS
ncbi:MAG: cyclic nucleotide-binding domain-containing protein [Calditrichia bacterium]